MAFVPRQYRSALPPSEPDEDYWAALLTHDEAEKDDLASAEEGDWEGVEAFKKSLFFDYTLAYGKAEDWEQAKATYHSDSTVMLAVIGFNKGGLLVEWGSLRGFVPSSQLVENLSPPMLTHAMEKYIGKRLCLRVIELHQEYNRLILSERAAQVLPGTRHQVLYNLTPESYCQGIVTNVCDFGVFVDLGGVEGLIYISELSWGRVEHPNEVLQRGQQIKVYIMDVDPGKGRVALSLKRLQPDPWVDVENRYGVGQQVEGIITSVVDFGAFAALEEGLEGLIHISELAEGHFLHPRNVVVEGQHVSVRILNINPYSRRIGLSLRK